MRRVLILPVTLCLLAAAAGGWLLARGPAPPSPPVPSQVSLIEPVVSAAIDEALSAVRQRPRDPVRRAALGFVYEGNELVPEALACFEQAVSLRNDEPKWWYRIALLRASLGDVPGAIDAADRVTRLERGYAPAFWRRGFWLLDSGRLDEAEASFREAMAIAPGEPSAALGLARLELQRGRAAHAEALLRPIADSSGPYARYAASLLGRALQRLGRADDASAALSRGGSEPHWFDPWHDEAMAYGLGTGAVLGHAQALAMRGRIADAARLLDDLRRRRPDDPVVLNNLGLLYRMAGRLDDSAAVLNEVIRARPEFAPARFSMAMTLIDQARQDHRADRAAALRRAAMTQLDSALAANPAMAEAHALRGELLEEAGDFAGAAAALDEAVRRSPDNPVWLHQLARLHVRLDRPDAARPLLARAARLAPDLPGLRETLNQVRAEAADDAAPSEARP